MSGERYPFGFRTVGPEEKKALVGAAFDAVARTYDRANTVFSLGIDGLWRREGIRRLCLGPGDRVLDVCGGTGALARLAARRAGRGGLSVVFDLNAAMLAAGRRRRAARGRRTAAAGSLAWVRGDAEAIGFADETFEAATIGFGLRNIVRLDRAFREIARVLKPGGRFVAVEFGRPRNPVLARLYGFYAFRVMPPAAALLFGNGGPYRYLAESVRVFQPPERTVEMLAEAGFGKASHRRLTAGLAVLFLAEKPGRA